VDANDERRNVDDGSVTNGARLGQGMGLQRPAPALGVVAMLRGAFTNARNRSDYASRFAPGPGRSKLVAGHDSGSGSDGEPPLVRRAGRGRSSWSGVTADDSVLNRARLNPRRLVGVAAAVLVVAVGGSVAVSRMGARSTVSKRAPLPLAGGTASLTNTASAPQAIPDAAAIDAAAPNVAANGLVAPVAGAVPGLLPIITVPAPPVTTTTILIAVHAAGAVNNPGVFVFDGMARVDDVVNAAGGLASNADDSGLNLAAPVVDGQRVFVPVIGKPVPTVLPVEVAAAAIVAEGQPVGSSGAGAKPGVGAAAPGGLIDLNTATAEQLDGLPGVGPATASAILAYRTEHGRFKSVGELMEVRGIGEGKFASIRPKVKV
jgi:competence protein ComEA